MSDPRIKPRVPSVNHEHPLARGLVGAWPVTSFTTPSDAVGGLGELRDVVGEVHGVLTSSGWPVFVNRSSLGGNPTMQTVGYAAGGAGHVNLGQPTWWNTVITKETSWSLSAWGKTSHTELHLLNKQNSGSPYRGVSLTLGGSGSYPGALQLQVWNSYPANQIMNQTTTRWDDDKWHLFTAVFRGLTGSMSGTSHIDLYVDGVAQPKQAVSSTTLSTNDLTSSSDAIMYGLRGTGNFRTPGEIQDLRVYARALTASEAMDMYYDKWSLYRSPEPVLANAAAGGFFDFDQLTGGMPDLRGGMV